MTHISVEHIAKIEGHARLDIRMDGEEVKVTRLSVFEGARYYEALVRGRHFADAPVITSRICGICTQAHTLASLQAVEKALRVRVSRQTEQLRNLIHLGSLMQSHVLHLFFLALPDFLGYDTAVAMAAKHGADVKRGLKLKQLANKVCAVVGGRQVHSVTMLPGGFSSLPTEAQLRELKGELLEAREDAVKTVRIFSKLKVPQFERKTSYLSVKTGRPFTLLKGRIVTSEKQAFKPESYRKTLVEEVVPESTAKNVKYKGGSFMVGALARINNSREMLSFNARKALKASKVKFPNYNPFMNNLAQAIEVLSFIDRMVSIIDELKLRDELLPKLRPRAGRGVSIIEAPRGLLVHECTLNSKGVIADYNIIAPTTMNIANIEDDIRGFLPQLAKKTEKQIVHEIEKLIRAYDPCISCSAHFLGVNWLT
jgi:sulfhydrogenase subunit alpha